MADYAALIGIDWSDKKHDICLIDPRTGRREAAVLRHAPAAIGEWATALRARFNGQPVAVCLEQARGPLVYALLKYDFITLYPVNPSTLSRYREAFSPSRHKDDAPGRRLPRRVARAPPRPPARLAPGLGADAHLALPGRASPPPG